MSCDRVLHLVTPLTVYDASNMRLSPKFIFLLVLKTHITRKFLDVQSCKSWILDNIGSAVDHASFENDVSFHRQEGGSEVFKFSGICCSCAFFLRISNFEYSYQILLFLNKSYLFSILRTYSCFHLVRKPCINYTTTVRYD